MIEIFYDPFLLGVLLGVPLGYAWRRVIEIGATERAERERRARISAYIKKHSPEPRK